MILYRAMCEKEFQDMSNHNSLSWNSKFKWFGTREFVISRVMDGKFNNSNFVSSRYEYLIEFNFADSSLIHFAKCGFKEYMLNIRKVPLVKLISWRVISEFDPDLKKFLTTETN